MRRFEDNLQTSPLSTTWSRCPDPLSCLTSPGLPFMSEWNPGSHLVLGCLVAPSPLCENFSILSSLCDHDTFQEIDLLFHSQRVSQPFYQGPDKCSGLLGHVALTAHLPCPSRKSALDKTWMNDRLCPSVASFMKRGGSSGLVLSLWFSCLCWKSFSRLSLSGVRWLIRNASFPHVCVQYSVKEVLMCS